MNDKPVELLLIEDNPGDARLIREYLSEIKNNPYLLECADQLSKGLELLAGRDVDLVLLDLCLPDSQGFDTFARVHALVPDLPIVVVTGSNDEMLAVQAVQTGAQDYLVKGEIDSGLLSRAMRYAIERKKTEIALRKAREELEVRVEKRTADLAKANEELRSEIAERCRVEEALRGEHSFRTAIIERAAEGLCVCHEIADHPFVEFTVWNERMTEITGYTMDDINRLGLYQSIHPEPQLQAKAIDRAARIRQGEDLIAEQWEIIRADREMRTVRISTSVLQSADGLPHVLALIDDVTEQKKAEAALKRSHGYLEKLVAERTIELRKTNDLLMLETSERKRANQELRKAHQQLQDIINFLPDATFVIDRQKRVIAWNRAIEEMTGVRQQEIIGKGDYAYAVPFYGERRPIIIDLVMGGENEADKKYDFVERKEKTVYGEVFVPKTYKGRGAYLWGTASPLFDQGGNVIGAIQSIRDISDRKQAAETVRQSEEKYRQLFETVSDAIFLFDADSRRFIDVNETALHLYGYTRDEFLGLKYAEITAEPDLSEKYMNETLAGTRTRVALRYHRNRDGTVFPVEISASTFNLPGQRVLCGVVRDITERIRTEEAIKQQVNFQQKLIDTIPSPIFYKDTEGRYLGCNSSFESYVGLCKADIIGKTVYEVAPTDLADIYREADLALFREPGVQQYETCLQYADGTRHDVFFIKGTFTGLDGRVAGIVGAILDITDRKRAEQELSRYRDRLEDLVKERTAELASTNERLTREVEVRGRAEQALQSASEKLKFFAYSVAHDLKSPAIGVYGLTKRLNKHARDVLDEKGRTYCDQILKVSEHIAALVEKINIYMATKETAPLVETTSIAEILRMLRDEFSTQLNIRQIKWFEPECDVEIKGDRLSILRIFRNLIDNALKYGGQSLTRISVGYEESENLHIFSVSDDGKGLKEADSEKIFGLFQRNETSRGVEGAGLGLAIVKEIAEQHGGRVWVEPTGKKGITFYISISKNLRPSKKTGRKPCPH
jgi:PAS domain S-box-containing protein